VKKYEVLGGAVAPAVCTWNEIKDWEMKWLEEYTDDSKFFCRLENKTQAKHGRFFTETNMDFFFEALFNYLAKSYITPQIISSPPGFRFQLSKAEFDLTPVEIEVSMRRLVNTDQ